MFFPRATSDHCIRKLDTNETRRSSLAKTLRRRRFQLRLRSRHSCRHISFKVFNHSSFQKSRTRGVSTRICYFAERTILQDPDIPGASSQLRKLWRSRTSNPQKSFLRRMHWASSWRCSFSFRGSTVLLCQHTFHVGRGLGFLDWLRRCFLWPTSVSLIQLG